MIVLKPKFNLVFFDRKIIKTNWKAINKRPLGRAGGMVRKVARGSIKRRKKLPSGKKMKQKPSTIPNPPFSRSNTGKTPPFKMIFNLPNKQGTSEIVGMVGFGGSGTPVPGLHEQGGTAVRRVFIKAGQRRTKRGRFGRIIRKPVRKTVRYPKRAFMKPALLKVRSQMPHLWKNSLGAIKGS